MEAILNKLVGWVWGTPLLVSVFFTGIWFTVGSRFFQFRRFGYVMRNTLFKMFSGQKTEGKGVLSPFQAVSVALAGTVGVGNIAGVASAIAIGGPGAIFWMWVSAMFGMINKMAESTLAVYYRDHLSDGRAYGGPTYYMEKGLGREKGFKLWPVFAILFGMGIFTTLFITLQNYTVAEAISSAYGLPMIGVSAVYTVLIYIVILGGIPRVGRFAERIVPFMAFFYILGCIFILLKYSSNVLPSLGLIFHAAFHPMAAVGGFGGAAVAMVVRTGISRSIYSNEAGWGTAAMAHSTARTDHPVRQGLWGVFEVFVDTMLVCTVTALVIIVTGEWSSGVSGATLTLNAFQHGFGATGKMIIAAGVFLFGWTTATGWYSYYEICSRHLGDHYPRLGRWLMTFVKYTNPIWGFLMVIMAVTIGLPSSYVWLFGDISAAIPTFLNLITILVLSGTFFRLVRDFEARELGGDRANLMEHVFYEDAHPGEHCSVDIEEVSEARTVAAD